MQRDDAQNPTPDDIPIPVPNSNEERQDLMAKFIKALDASAFSGRNDDNTAEFESEEPGYFNGTVVGKCSVCGQVQTLNYHGRFKVTSKAGQTDQANAPTEEPKGRPLRPGVLSSLGSGANVQPDLQQLVELVQDFAKEVVLNELPHGAERNSSKAALENAVKKYWLDICCSYVKTQANDKASGKGLYSQDKAHTENTRAKGNPSQVRREQNRPLACVTCGTPFCLLETSITSEKLSADDSLKEKLDKADQSKASKLHKQIIDAIIPQYESEEEKCIKNGTKNVKDRLQLLENQITSISTSVKKTKTVLQELCDIDSRLEFAQFQGLIETAANDVTTAKNAMTVASRPLPKKGTALISAIDKAKAQLATGEAAIQRASGVFTSLFASAYGLVKFIIGTITGTINGMIAQLKTDLSALQPLIEAAALQTLNQDGQKAVKIPEQVQEISQAISAIQEQPMAPQEQLHADIINRVKQFTTELKKIIDAEKDVKAISERIALKLANVKAAAKAEAERREKAEKEQQEKERPKSKQGLSDSQRRALATETSEEKKSKSKGSTTPQRWDTDYGGGYTNSTSLVADSPKTRSSKKSTPTLANSKEGETDRGSPDKGTTLRPSDGTGQLPKSGQTQAGSASQKKAGNADEEQIQVLTTEELTRRLIALEKKVDALPTTEALEALLTRKFEDQKTEREAEIAAQKAEREAEIAAQKAEREAEIAAQKTQRKAEIAAQKAEREAEIAAQNKKLGKLTQTQAALINALQAIIEYAQKNGWDVSPIDLATKEADRKPDNEQE